MGEPWQGLLRGPDFVFCARCGATSRARAVGCSLCGQTTEALPTWAERTITSEDGSRVFSGVAAAGALLVGVPSLVAAGAGVGGGPSGLLSGVLVFTGLIAVIASRGRRSFTSSPRLAFVLDGENEGEVELVGGAVDVVRVTRRTVVREALDTSGFAGLDVSRLSEPRVPEERARLRAARVLSARDRGEIWIRLVERTSRHGCRRDPLAPASMEWATTHAEELVVTRPSGRRASLAELTAAPDVARDREHETGHAFRRAADLEADRVQTALDLAATTAPRTVAALLRAV